jgi:hypothetical protein
VRWFEAATPACAWDCAFPLRSCIPSFVRRNRWGNKKDARRSNGFPPPAPPGNRGRSSAIPARPSATVAEGLGTARFTKPRELKNRRSARCPRVVALVQLHPPKPPPRPPDGSHCLGYHLGPGAGWWVTGATGRANCACYSFYTPAWMLLVAVLANSRHYAENIEANTAASFVLPVIVLYLALVALYSTSLSIQSALVRQFFARAPSCGG